MTVPLRRSSTAALIAREQVGFPCPLRHVWQEDAGFRVARVRNLAIAATDCDYVLLIDGDMVLHPRFVEDHVRAARPGGFVQGMRVLTTPAGRERMLRAKASRACASVMPGCAVAAIPCAFRCCRGCCCG